MAMDHLEGGADPYPTKPYKIPRNPTESEKASNDYADRSCNFWAAGPRSRALPPPRETSLAVATKRRWVTIAKTWKLEPLKRHSGRLLRLSLQTGTANLTTSGRTT